MSPTETCQKVPTGWQSLRSGSITPFGGSTPPPSDPGNFLDLGEIDLTTDLGWTQSSGNRALDSSVNRAAQTTYSGAGMMITAERANTSPSTTIYSSDAQGRFYDIPNWHALEADITMGDYLGVGCFPALWARPNNGGQGEIDYWEIMGGQPANNSRYKGTMILTSASPYNVAQKAVQFDSNGESFPTLGVMKTYRIEKIPGQINFRINGVLRGTITQAQMNAQSNSPPNDWATQFENASRTWYPRFTYQFGPPTDGRSFNPAGAVPSTWLSSTMLMSRLQIYEYTGP